YISLWPFVDDYSNLTSNYAVCWNDLQYQLYPIDINVMPTNSVSNLFSILLFSKQDKLSKYTNMFLNSKNGITKIQSAGNQRYLSNQSNLVGTSETTRVTTKENDSFNQWFAGLIDGNGCFLISKKDTVLLKSPLIYMIFICFVIFKINLVDLLKCDLVPMHIAIVSITRME
uniref:LAGLIDADG homing endonuclease n=1 Tax=Malassezia brasiliensis TaxID=1821822 RepID=UPI003002DBD5